MEILKVIVEKKPKGCFQCSLLVIGADLMCIVNRKIIKNDKECPKECPLIEEEDTMEWLLRKPPKPILAKNMSKLEKRNDGMD